MPIIRRGQGGGATYLDGNQVFYQIVARNSEAVPHDVEGMFKRLLSVTVETYRRFGLDAQFKPLNDVVVGNKKISGNGAGVHESASILVGNVILDLDYDMMARVLKVPDEKFRDKMAKSMRDWVTSLRGELGMVPDAERVKETYSEAFQRILNVELEKMEPSDLEWKIFNEEVKPRHMSREWLYMEPPISSTRRGRSVKIAGDVKVVESDHKARKLIRVRAEVKGDEILGIQIRGDYFAVPEQAMTRLEESLQGVRLNEASISQAVESFYNETKVQTPGIGVADFTSAVMKIRELL